MMLREYRGNLAGLNATWLMTRLLSKVRDKNQ
jgi:hypothetical protein